MNSRKPVVVVLVAIVAGLAWWLWLSPAAEPSSATSKPAVATPKPQPLAPSASPPKSTDNVELPKLPAATGSAATATSTTTAAKGHAGLQYAVGPLDGAEMIRGSLNRYLTNSRERIPYGVAGLENPGNLEFRVLFARYSRRSGMVLADAQDGDLENVVVFDGLVYYEILSSGNIIGQIATEVDPATNQTKNVEGATIANPRFLQAIDKLTALDQVRAASYEIRYLDIWKGSTPAPAIWLKSTEAGGADLVYTLDYAPLASLKANTLYTAMEFLEAFRQAAQATQPQRSGGSN